MGNTGRPLAVTIVVATAFTYREVLTTDVVVYASVPIALFVISLALRNWWGHKAETQLRNEAIASKFQLQLANQGLWDEMQNRSRIEDECCATPRRWRPWGSSQAAWHMISTICWR